MDYPFCPNILWILVSLRRRKEEKQREMSLLNMFNMFIGLCLRALRFDRCFVL